MIKLDSNYSLKNNNIHGVELVFEETRTRKSKKDDSEQEYTFTETYYYPNPISALKQWISLTNNATDLSELVKHYERCVDLIEKVYQEFKNNKRKL